jgi:hypothetical protein
LYGILPYIANRGRAGDAVVSQEEADVALDVMEECIQGRSFPRRLRSFRGEGRADRFSLEL